MTPNDIPANLAYATRPFEGETCCGDACGWWQNDHRLVLAVADGLGHGVEASQASQAALACIATHLQETLETLFENCNVALRHTRGAALAIAIIDAKTQQVSVGCVGNIRVQWIHQQRIYRLDGARGIVGGGYGRVVPEIRTLSAGDRLVMFSDGLDDCLPLLSFFATCADLSVQRQTETLIERWARSDDDASALIYEHHFEQQP